MNGYYEYNPTQNLPPVCTQHKVQMQINTLNSARSSPNCNWACPVCVLEQANQEANIGAFYPHTRFPEGSEL